MYDEIIDLSVEEVDTHSNQTAKKRKLSPEFTFIVELINLVKSNRLLYDAKHPEFLSYEAKKNAWKTIGRILNKTSSECMETWCKLRFEYQLYVRDLRLFLQTAGNESKRNEKRQRPTMAFESEMIFLYSYVAHSNFTFNTRDSCLSPYFSIELEGKPSITTSTLTLTAVPKADTVKLNVDNDDDVIFVDIEPVEVIDLDNEEQNKKDGHFAIKPYKITKDVRLLVGNIRVYPELYDTTDKYFNDYKRRGFIWSAIANELKDKATKLMKQWICLQLRYEWEISTIKEQTEPSALQKLMDFMKPNIENNANTIYKQSFYLKQKWEEPIEYFKNICCLLGTLKLYPQLINLTENQLLNPNKSYGYHEMWNIIAKKRCCSPGQCETTWLVLRSFYWELMNMRKQSYQLQDKWYFENIINEMYALTNQSQTTAISAMTPQVPTVLTEVSKELSVVNCSLPSHSSASSFPSSKMIGVSFDEDSIQSTTVVKNLSTKRAVATSISMNDIEKHKHSNSRRKKMKIPQILSVISINASSNISTPNAASSTADTPVAATDNEELKDTNSPTKSKTDAVTNHVIGIKNITSSLPSMPILSISNFSNNPKCSTPMAIPHFSTRSTPQLLTSNCTQPSQTLDIRAKQNLTSITASTSSKTPCRSSIATPTSVPFKTIPILDTNSTNKHCMPTKNAGCSLQPHELQQNLSQPAKTILPTNINIPNQKMTTTVKIELNSSSLPTSNSSDLTNADTNLNSTSLQVPSTQANNNSMKTVDPISILNPNEIMIELISMPQGNNLVVHGPPLATKYTLSMPETVKFIREVMAIPLLHNKEFNKSTQITHFWNKISEKINLPAHICRASWNFLSENLAHFPQIAPMEELMRPFKNDLNVWEISHDLFRKFNAMAIEKGWLKYQDELPALMESIGAYSCLYRDVIKHNNTTFPNSEKDDTHAWGMIRLKFEITDEILVSIWKSFKEVLVKYMCDLERSIENKWPQNWWRTLVKMKFLMEARYHSREPFYYIVHNKFFAEASNCQAFEKKYATAPSLHTAKNNKVKKILASEESTTPNNCESETSKRKTNSTPLFVKKSKENAFSSSKSVTSSTKIFALKTPTTKTETIPTAITTIYTTIKAATPTATNSPTTKIPASTIATKTSTMVSASTTIKEVSTTSVSQTKSGIPKSKHQTLSDIDVYELLSTMRNYPHIYQKAMRKEKTVAWRNLAKDMKTSLSNCRLTFQYALKKYRTYKVCDSENRCNLNQKYFKHLDEMYRVVKPQSKLIIKTPMEVNRSISTSTGPTEVDLPESYIPNINMKSCKPSLVVENLSYALDSLSTSPREKIEVGIRNLFKKYGITIE